MIDTDGDCYNDKVDSRPLKCNVFKYALKNKKYIKVSNINGISYGGDQNWFKGDADVDYRIKNYGCGLIAATDLFLYEALKERRCVGYLNILNFYYNGIFSYNAYKKIVYDFERNYFKVLPSIGVNGLSLQRYE